jgi:pimeloyl-ACP methyl ester carboxylesterase/class 3 adenylate cyclase
VATRAETRYARTGDVHLAYRVFGEGAVDILAIPGLFLPMEALGDDSPAARFIRRLTSFSRFIQFDRRGIGLSDPISSLNPPTMEQWMQDALCVVDAVGADQVAVLGIGDGALSAVLLAATHPARVRALVLLHGTARLAWASDTPWGRTEDVQVGYEAGIDQDTGRGLPFETLAPSVAGEERFREWMTGALRRGASPGAAKLLGRMIYETDVRAILPTVNVPTLVIHRRDNRFHDPAHSRYLAEHIPGARYVEVPGEDHLPFVGDIEPIIEEIEEFLTGVRVGPEPDRVLATVLFTDIVDSTRMAAEMGDRRWGEVLEDHNAAVRRQLDRFRGREVDTTGDGFLAMFDGPARAIHSAIAIRDVTHQLGIEVRLGLHTGEIELVGDRVSGIAVHIGARVAAAAGPGEVLVSRTVTDLVAGSGIEFEDRGERDLKGVPGPRRLFAVLH